MRVEPEANERASASSGLTGRLPTGSGDARARRELFRCHPPDRGGGLRAPLGIDEFQPFLQLARVSPERRFFLCQKTRQMHQSGWLDLLT